MDIQLNYEEHGSGFPLILLHGNGETHAYFKYQIPAFSQSYRTIAVDTRGHGQSPRGTMPFTLNQFADDLHDFMNQHEIEKAHLLGFSDGANIAILFALKYPECVEKLILDGGNLFPSGILPSCQIPMTFDYYLTKIKNAFTHKYQHKLDLLGLMVNEPHIDPKTLGKIPHPTLVMAGTEDLIKPKHTELIAQSIPNAQLSWIPGGHSIGADNPKDFNQAVLNFLN